MFDALSPLIADPILGLMAAYRRDPRREKVDLGVGVYRDESGGTPVLDSVKRAEARLLSEQDSKAYIGPEGSGEFNARSLALLLGEAPDIVARARSIQTPGGCGALRAGAELIRRARPEATVWVSDPTWANHMPLLGSAGLKIREYPYYDADGRALCFDRMLDALGAVPAGDVVLLHGCCHNPCGADLSDEQWRAVATVVVERGLVPFVDVAYQGFGEGVEADVAGVRSLAAAVPELLVASSCSKNFGLYRERTGALTVLAQDGVQADRARDQVCSAIRGMWSMPPDHGAAVVACILGDAALRALWEGEVGAMRERINALRRDLVAGLGRAGAGDFGFIARERGMFSFLGVSAEQVGRLQRDFGIYLVDSGRVNVAGLNDANLDYVCQAVAAVMA